MNIIVWVLCPYCYFDRIPSFELLPEVPGPVAGGRVSGVNVPWGEIDALAVRAAVGLPATMGAPV